VWAWGLLWGHADKRHGHICTFCAPRVGRVVARRSVAASKGDAFRTMVTEWGGIGAGWLSCLCLWSCMGGLKSEWEDRM